MKIGIFSPYLNALTGGEKYIFTAASCLSKEHNVTIFWDDKTIASKASEKFNLDLNNINFEENIFSPKFGVVKRFLKTLKYDRILFLSDGSIPVVGSKKLLIHFQFPVEWLETNSWGFMIKKSRIAKIICNSYFTKQFIDKKFSTNSFVLYPPAETNSIPIPSKEKLILTVGRFSVLSNGTDFKKLQVLVDAFKKFQKKRLKGWKLIIVTSVNESDEENFDKFKDNVNSRYIEVYKNASYDKIIEFYRKSKIYWHAAGFGEDLEKNPERAEHFGISTVEAMSYGGVPIVANAGGQKEIVRNGENGYLWNSEEELIDRTHKLAVDDTLMNELSENAIDASKKFNRDRFCEELNHLIW